MDNLIAHIDDRGRAMPQLTAVRWNGEVVTHGVLRQRLVDYDRAVSAEDLSEAAGLVAALMSLMPESLRGLQPGAQAESVAEVLAWLSRDVDGAVDDLVAVG
ncbi:MAG: hypothetical protein QM728_11345 [Gordonia sp. (in: high G+C Gram-positive bacteria)]|uniref:hypothetical protein n=1 Tax=Gordonia sp. (in: high G+C Gram-positive bacteria) TaxID=84139 RepID=UPI0039E5470F